MNAQALWLRAKNGLSELVDSKDFRSWIDEPLRVDAARSVGAEFVLLALNNFFRKWAVDNYFEAILDALKEASGGQVQTLRLELDPNPPKGQLDLRVDSPAKKSSQAQANGHGLNPRWTFATFIPGDHNYVAWRACQSLTNGGPHSESYNPLYISGHSGLGKTHLAHALAAALLVAKKFSGDVRVVSAERFMNEFVDSIKSGKTDLFQKKYRRLGVLVIDDLQFLSHKTRTQEELRFVMNELINQGSLVVFTADCAPWSLKDFELALQSRLGQGLTVSVSEPEAAAAAEFVRAKAARECPGEVLISEVVELIIESCRDYRALEGAVIALIAHASFRGSKLDDFDRATAEKILRLRGRRAEPLTAEQIMAAINKAFKFDTRLLRDKGRKAGVVKIRRLFAFLAQQLMGANYSEIARMLGKDHSSVIGWVQDFTARIEAEERIALSLVQQVMEHLPGHYLPRPVKLVHDPDLTNRPQAPTGVVAAPEQLVMPFLLTS